MKAATLKVWLALMVVGVSQQCFDADIKPQILDSESFFDALKGSPKMHHAFTLQPSVLDYLIFALGTTSTSARINIAWGDGSVMTVMITSARQDIEHTYTHGGFYSDYTMRITGDLNKITFFSSYYGGAQFTAIDFRTLIKLEEIDIGLTPAPSVIDLSHNHKLVKVTLTDLEDVQSLILPSSHNISAIDLYGLDFTTEDIDGVIDNIYKNTVIRNITNGTFVLEMDDGDENEEGQMMGPPSMASIKKLRELQHRYGWTIIPALP